MDTHLEDRWYGPFIAMGLVIGLPTVAGIVLGKIVLFACGG